MWQTYLKYCIILIERLIHNTTEVKIPFLFMGANETCTIKGETDGQFNRQRI